MIQVVLIPNYGTSIAYTGLSSIEDIESIDEQIGYIPGNTMNEMDDQDVYDVTIRYVGSNKAFDRFCNQCKIHNEYV